MVCFDYIELIKYIRRFAISYAYHNLSNSNSNSTRNNITIYIATNQFKSNTSDKSNNITLAIASIQCIQTK